MSLKYRIVYDNHPKYSKKHNVSIKTRHYVSTLIIILIALSLLFSPFVTHIYDIILPGNPDVTRNALHEFSNTIDRGESLVSALDVFCNAIISNR